MFLISFVKDQRLSMILLGCFSYEKAIETNLQNSSLCFIFLFLLTFVFFHLLAKDLEVRLLSKVEGEGSCSSFSFSFLFPLFEKVPEYIGMLESFPAENFFFCSFLPRAKDSTTFQLFSQTENLAILYHYSRAFGKSHIKDIITCLSFLEVQCLVFLLFACLTVPVLKVLLLENHFRKISILKKCKMVSVFT